MSDDEYTPTIEVIRHALAYPRERLGEPRPISNAQFDRALAAHDREVAAKALRDAVDEVRASDWWHGSTNINFSDRVREWLRARAAAIVSEPTTPEGKTP